MSNPFYMVVWIVAIVMVAGLIEKYMKLKAKSRDNSAELDADTNARIVELEERVQVLERIVTENKFDLKKQINDL
ncbi:MAG: hypothetical protein AAGA33_04025 [Pseudomonadota bacterium]